jgi:hypothetical protein
MRKEKVGGKKFLKQKVMGSDPGLPHGFFHTKNLNLGKILRALE